MTTQLKQHPLSAAFPAMPDEDFQALKDSIEAIGVQNAITTYEGMILDGWHRYQAAISVGLDCPVQELDEWVDPRDFVLAQNKARRHITVAQLALAATEVYKWRGAGRPNNSAGPAELNQPEISERTGVSVRSLRQAEAVKAKAAPEVVEAVKQGRVGLEKAAAIAKLPKEQQAEAINKPTPKAEPPQKKAAKQPEPAVEPDSHELDAAAETIRQLDEENTQLRDRLAAEAMEASAEEKTLAAETIAELRALVRTLEAELDAVKTSRDVLQRENAELKKQVLMQQRLLKKTGGLKWR